MKFSFYISKVYSNASSYLSADCGSPPPLTNGSFEFVNQQVPSTIQGSKVVYQCNTGYVPTVKYPSVCTASGKWSWDTNEIQCKGRHNILHKHVCALLWNSNFQHAADCRDPVSPSNGYVMHYEITTEGAIIHYGCNDSFVPEELQSAVCTPAGTWEPNPEALDCKIPGKYMMQLWCCLMLAAVNSALTSCATWDTVSSLHYIHNWWSRITYIKCACFLMCNRASDVSRPPAHFNLGCYTTTAADSYSVCAFWI